MKWWLVPISILCVLLGVVMLAIMCYPYPHQFRAFESNYAGKAYAFEEFEVHNQTEAHIKWRGPGRYFIAITPGRFGNKQQGISGATDVEYTEWRTWGYGKDLIGGNSISYGWYLDLKEPTCVYLYQATINGIENYFTIHFGDSSYVQTVLTRAPGRESAWTLADIPDAVLELVQDNAPDDLTYTPSVKYGAVLYTADDDPSEETILWASDTNTYHGILWWEGS